MICARAGAPPLELAGPGQASCSLPLFDPLDWACVESWGHLFAIPTMLTEMTAPLVFTTWAMKEFRLTTNPLFIVFGIALLAMWCGATRARPESTAGPPAARS